MASVFATWHAWNLSSVPIGVGSWTTNYHRWQGTLQVRLVISLASGVWDPLQAQLRVVDRFVRLDFYSRISDQL